jgi:hypothetical protein
VSCVMGCGVLRCAGDTCIHAKQRREPSLKLGTPCGRAASCCIPHQRDGGVNRREHLCGTQRSSTQKTWNLSHGTSGSSLSAASVLMSEPPATARVKAPCAATASLAAVAVSCASAVAAASPSASTCRAQPAELREGSGRASVTLRAWVVNTRGVSWNLTRGRPVCDDPSPCGSGARAVVIGAGRVLRNRRHGPESAPGWMAWSWRCTARSAAVRGGRYPRAEANARRRREGAPRGGTRRTDEWAVGGCCGDAMCGRRMRQREEGQGREALGFCALTLSTAAVLPCPASCGRIAESRERWTACCPGGVAP